MVDPFCLARDLNNINIDNRSDNFLWFADGLSARSYLQKSSIALVRRDKLHKNLDSLRISSLHYDSFIDDNGITREVTSFVVWYLLDWKN